MQNIEVYKRYILITITVTTRTKIQLKQNKIHDHMVSTLETGMEHKI